MHASKRFNNSTCKKDYAPLSSQKKKAKSKVKQLTTSKKTQHYDFFSGEKVKSPNQIFDHLSDDENKLKESEMDEEDIDEVFDESEINENYIQHDLKKLIGEEYQTINTSRNFNSQRKPFFDIQRNSP